MQFSTWDQSNNILGGGHHFLYMYNVEKPHESQLFPQFNKVSISSLANISESTALIGTFMGGLTIFDSRVGALEEAISRPHVDAVMSISTNPINEFIFATMGRKDNFTYVWDVRNYSQPLERTFLGEL